MLYRYYTLKVIITTIVVFSFNVDKINSQPINQFKDNLKTGYWINFYNDSLRTIESTGKFKKGNQKGVWKYYTPNGTLNRKEIYRFRKIKTTFYYPTGIIYKKGYSKIDLTFQTLHYYFTGRWKIYAESGKLEKYEYFKRGIKISEKVLIKKVNPNLNTNLISELSTLRSLRERSQDSLIFIYDKYGANSNEYRRLKEWKVNCDTLIKSKISEITSKYNYPSAEYVGEEVNTLFYLISTSEQKTKEKYYNLIVDASDKGIISRTDVAYFIDKVKVGKGEFQTYGTQYKLNKEKNRIEYYQIHDEENVNQRRKAVGLEEINWSEQVFIKQ